MPSPAFVLALPLRPPSRPSSLLRRPSSLTSPLRPRPLPRTRPPCACAASPAPPVPPPSSPSPLRALYAFSRPHTIRGTILGCFSGVARALRDHPLGPRAALNPALFPLAALGVAALVLGNAFIVGINQIFDVRIDTINKPFLPLASGALSSRAAWVITLASAAGGLAIVLTSFAPLIQSLYIFGLTVGTLYSVPPFRLKRSPFAAAVTISAVRGFLMNFGVYYATASALGLPFAWSPPIIFLAAFMTLFASVIALAKDMPDIRGDRADSISTFATRAGPRAVFRVVVAMLMTAYAGAIIAGTFAPVGAFRRAVMIPGHALLALALARKYRTVNPEKQEHIVDFYKFIWTLFYSGTFCARPPVSALLGAGTDVLLSPRVARRRVHAVSFHLMPSKGRCFSIPAVAALGARGRHVLHRPGHLCRGAHFREYRHPGRVGMIARLRQLSPAIACVQNWLDSDCSSGERPACMRSAGMRSAGMRFASDCTLWSQCGRMFVYF